MKLRTRTAEKKSQVSTKTVPKEAECACADIVTGLILCGVPQFTRVLPASDGVVKIPDGFVREHRDMIGRKVTLEPKDAKGRVFEVTLTTRMVGRRQSALLFGTGWREFRSESRVREGDLLIFALVGSSQFVVYILRGHIEIAKRAMASLSTTPHPPARESSSPKRTAKKQPEEKEETRDKPIAEKNRHPYFERRLQANAFKGRGKRGRGFEFPQAFLRLHANAVGDTVEFVDSRSRQVWRIETFSYVPATGRRVFLSTGWLQFLDDNKLQQGDVLAIALIAHSKFLVSVVARASDESDS